MMIAVLGVVPSINVPSTMASASEVGVGSVGSAGGFAGSGATRYDAERTALGICVVM